MTKEEVIAEGDNLAAQVNKWRTVEADAKRNKLKAWAKLRALLPKYYSIQGVDILEDHDD